MTPIARKSDGRRIFTDAFKRKHIDRVLRGDLTIAELGRSLGVARSLLQRWKRFLPQDGGISHTATWRERGAGDSQAAHVRELQLLIGKQTVELELLRVELETLKRARRPRASNASQQRK